MMGNESIRIFMFHIHFRPCVDFDVLVNNGWERTNGLHLVGDEITKQFGKFWRVSIVNRGPTWDSGFSELVAMIPLQNCVHSDDLTNIGIVGILELLQELRRDVGFTEESNLIVLQTGSQSDGMKERLL